MTDVLHAPAVTVLIPVYNGENYLAEAVASVLAQSYRDFELVIVDDGSQDGTWAVVEQCMADHPDVVRGLRQPNGGVASALNAGIRAARGKYIAWLSHDDRFLPHKLAAQMAMVARQPEIVGVYGDYTYIDAAGVCVGRAYAAWYPPEKMLRHFLQNVFINGSTLLVERRCLLEVGLFDESLRYANDALMWAHLIVRYPLGYIPEPLTEYRIHPQQNTHKRRAIHRDNERWLRKALQAYPLRRVFPELDRPDATAADVAAGYTFLGDVLTIRYWHLWFGIQQYWRAWWAWPHPRNPVWKHVKAVVDYRVRQKLDRAAPVVPAASAPFTEVDLRYYSETVPDIFPDIEPDAAGENAA